MSSGVFGMFSFHTEEQKRNKERKAQKKELKRKRREARKARERHERKVLEQLAVEEELSRMRLEGDAIEDEADGSNAVPVLNRGFGGTSVRRHNSQSTFTAGGVRESNAPGQVNPNDSSAASTKNNHIPKLRRF